MAKPDKSKKKKPWQKPWEKEKDEDEVTENMKAIREVRRSIRSASSAGQLFSMLSEEHIFSSGQKVYIAGSMGQTNVEATFKRMGDGGMAVVQTVQGEMTVMPHMIYPLRRS